MGTTETQTPSVEQQVNELLSKHVVDGKLVLPEDIDPLLAAAVRSEKKARDTQASYTRSRQELAGLKKKVSTYETLVTEVAGKAVSLTPEQAQELEELKEINPDEWHKKLVDYEEQAKKQVRDQLTKAEQEAIEAQEIARREAVLEEFNRGREIPIDDNIENLVPSSYMANLDNGTWTFEEFLQKSAKFIDTDKVATGKQETLEQPNLGEVGGGTHPTEPKPEEVIASYNEIAF